MEITGPASFAAVDGGAVEAAAVTSLAVEPEVAGVGLPFLESHAVNKVSPRTKRVAGVLVMAAECTPEGGLLFPMYPPDQSKRGSAVGSALFSDTWRTLAHEPDEARGHVVARYGCRVGCTTYNTDYIDLILPTYRQYADAAGYQAHPY